MSTGPPAYVLMHVRQAAADVLAFHVQPKRFVVAQVSDRQNAEAIADLTAEASGIAWDNSPDAIEIGAMDVA